MKQLLSIFRPKVGLECGLISLETLKTDTGSLNRYNSKSEIFKQIIPGEMLLSNVHLTTLSRKKTKKKT